MGLSEVLLKPVELIKKKPAVLLPYALFSIASAIVSFLLISLPTYSTVLPYFVQLNQTINSASAGQASVLPTTGEMISTVAGAYNIPLLIVYAIVVALVLVFLHGFFVSMAKQGKGKKVSIGGALAETKSKFLSLLGANVIVALIFVLLLAIYIGLIAVGVLLGTIGIILMLILGTLIFFIGLLAYSILFYQINVAVVIEGKRAVDAVKRSIEIGKKNALIIFALLIIVAVIVGVIEFIFGLAVLPLNGGASLSTSTSSLSQISQYVSVAALIASIISAVVGSICETWILLVAPQFYYEYIAKGKQATAKKK